MKAEEIIKSLHICYTLGEMCSDCSFCGYEECNDALMEKTHELIHSLINGQKELLRALHRKEAEVKKLKDSRDRWKRNAQAFCEASRITEKELEALYEEIERLKNDR